MYERFLAFRRGLGMEIIPTHGGARPPFDVLADRIRAAHVVPLLADQLFAAALFARGIDHELIVHPGIDHLEVAVSTTVLDRIREWYRNKGVL